ncbi:MAG: NAD(P)H-hydrate dehydratase [Ignavibacteriae bacterium]|nr:NAD(P)H-hydrate dehydratase [Ignavibacteriota bacterium]
MKYLLTAEQAYKTDVAASKTFGIPSLVLMENAARSASDIIREQLEKHLGNKPIASAKILILCGNGNNGGDGFAIARHLHEITNVAAAFVGSPDKMSLETKTNYSCLQFLEIPLLQIETNEDIDFLDLRHYDCIVDALIGIGGTGTLRGIVLPLLQKVRDYQFSVKKNFTPLMIAIDCPTGLDVTKGIANPYCFCADITITFFAEKTGLYRNDGLNVCGEIITASIGAPQSIIHEYSSIGRLEKSDIREMLPYRRKIGSKFDFGRVMIIAGSLSMPGAAALCANAAISAGAGLVDLYSTSFHPSVMAEVMPTALPWTADGTLSLSNFDTLLRGSKKAAVIAIGPGLGSCPETIELIHKLLSSIPVETPVILDADGLRALLLKPKIHLRNTFILTPHSGEFARLLGMEREKVEHESADLAVQFAKKNNCVLLLKGTPSIITDGDFSYWNTHGNSGMATAGCGDVLTGLIAALISQGIKPFEGAALGAYLHASAGDWYAKQYSKESLTASKLLDGFRHILPL